MYKTIKMTEIKEKNLGMSSKRNDKILFNNNNNGYF